MIATEIWKDICGYEGLYMVSNLGRVKGVPRKGTYNHEHILVGHNNSCGYRQVILTKNGTQKKYFVHRLVAKAFIENPLNLPEINHKDENKENNSTCNLEWCDRAYNVNYGSRTEKTRKRVAMYSKDGQYIRSFNSYHDAVVFLSKSNQSNISRAAEGKRHSAYGFLWKREGVS